MHDKKDIADLLEDVQTIVHTLRDEKIALRDQVSGLEAQLSLVKEEKAKESFELYSIAILIQGWLAGIFLGKVVTGTYSGGFQHSIILVLIAFASIMLIQSGIVSVGALF